MATLKGALKAGKKFAGEAATKKKNQMVAGLGNAVFGSGIVGGALNKSFQKKFGEKQEGDDARVANALAEQEATQDNNNATLARIETIVMNIADNIYNIAGVLNAQVVSMKEAQKLQQERAFKNAAAEEERNAEALKLASPAPAASTTPTESSEDKKGGIMGLVGSLMSTKNLFKGFLKKFAIFAAGVTAVGLAGAAVSSTFLGNPPAPANEIPQTGDTPIPLPPTGAGGGRGSQGVSSMDMQPVNQNSSEAPPPLPPTGAGGGRGSQGVPLAETSSQTAENPPSVSSADVSPPAYSVGAGGGRGGQGGATAEQAALVSQPPAPPPAAMAVAAAPISSASAGNNAESDPKGAHDFVMQSSQIQVEPRADGSFVDIKTGAPVSEEQVKQKIQATGKDPEKVITQVKKYQEETGKATGNKSQAPNISMGPAGGAVAASAPSSGSVGASAGGGGSSSMGASPVAPSPTTGASIGQTSTAVAAASESMSPKVSTSQINNNTTSGDAPPPTAIPSPIAGRGSLDIGTVFNSGA